MIRMTYVDATFTDLESTSMALEVMKFSAPFLVQRNGGDCILHGLVDGVMWSEGNLIEAITKGSKTVRKASLSVFEARFEPLILDGEACKDVYCLKQPVLLAMEMKLNFGVNVLVTNELGDQEIEHKQGQSGDYLVHTAASTNDVVRKIDFERQYAPLVNGRIELPKEAEVHLRASIKKAREKTRAVEMSIQ